VTVDLAEEDRAVMLDFALAERCGSPAGRRWRCRRATGPPRW